MAGLGLHLELTVSSTLHILQHPNQTERLSFSNTPALWPSLIVPYMLFCLLLSPVCLPLIPQVSMVALLLPESLTCPPQPDLGAPLCDLKIPCTSPTRGYYNCLNIFPH